MTQHQRQTLKQNLTSLITVSNFILLLGFIWFEAQRQERVENHMQNNEIHHNYKSNSKYFVPRTEVQLQLKSIEDMLKEMRKQQDKLRNK